MSYDFGVDHDTYRTQDPTGILPPLRMGKVLDWYDGPILFLAHAEDERVWLAMFAYESERGALTGFTYCPLDAEDLASLHAGTFDARAIYLDASKPPVVMVYHRSGVHVGTEQMVRPLSDDWIPLESWVLEPVE